jgi:ABC-2 type transport system ATP-binding protein
MAVLKVDHLTKDYGNNKGVFDVTFEIKEGEVFGFLGPNGSGKTTTIRHILGFSKPHQGSTWIDGLNSWEQPDLIQQELGYLPGEIAFPNDMTGSQFIKMMADMRGLKDMTKAQYLIGKFQLDPTGDLKRMSKGMKQKIGIVCAFMHNPKVLVLDEPTSGLDPLMQSTFVELIQEEKKQGKTILMSSHMLEEVDDTCDRIGVIRQGKLISIILSAEIKHTNKKSYKIEFTTQDDFERFVNEKLEFKEVNAIKNQVKIIVQDKDINTLIRIMTNYDLKFFSEIKFSLEDYFMHLYGGEEVDK